MSHTNPTDAQLADLLASTTTIAIVGASGNPERPSFNIMRQLQQAGFTVIPVNPRESEILGQTVYASLADIPVPIDIVDVFRKAEDTPAVADEAVAIAAKVLWLQTGITNEDAAARARAGGLTVVMDTCIGVTQHRLGISKG